MKKRILSMLLVLVLMATLVPLHADAAVTISGRFRGIHI